MKENNMESNIEKKYEFAGEITTVQSITGSDDETILHRIRALRSFGDVKKGDLGGFIEKEENLSHDGNCWVYDDAMVYDGAVIYRNATVRNEAVICCNAVITDNATVSDESIVDSNSVVRGCARIYGKSHITGNISINDNAHVYENAILGGSMAVSGNARVHGTTNICVNCCSILGDVDIEDSKDCVCFPNGKWPGEFKCLTFINTKDGSMQVTTLFNRPYTLTEFENLLEYKELEEGFKYRAEVLLLMDFVKKYFDIDTIKNENRSSSETLNNLYCHVDKNRYSINVNGIECDTDGDTDGDTRDEDPSSIATFENMTDEERANMIIKILAKISGVL